MYLGSIQKTSKGPRWCVEAACFKMHVSNRVHNTTILPLVWRQFTCVVNCFVVQKHLDVAAHRNIWVPCDQTRVCTTCSGLQNQKPPMSWRKRPNEGLQSEYLLNWRGGQTASLLKLYYHSKWENRNLQASPPSPLLQAVNLYMFSQQLVNIKIQSSIWPLNLQVRQAGNNFTSGQYATT